MRGRVAAIAVGTVTAVLAPGAGAAFGHGETTPVIRTVVDGLSSPVPGVDVRIVPGLPTDVSLTNSTATEVAVIGALREPFLRIGPRGVYANANSPTWYASGNPDGIALNLPRSARAGAPPRWKRVSGRPVWAWFDRRVQPPGPQVPPQARNGRRTIRLTGWSLPLRYRGRSLSVQGHVEFRPQTGSIVPLLRSPSHPAPGVTAGLLGGAAPGLFVENDSRTPVTVTGADGRPFARIGPRGVDVNSASSTFRAQGTDVRGARPIAGVPGWRHVADVPRYGWVDPRMRYPSLDPPSDVGRRDHPVVLRHWSIRIDTAAGPRAIAGTTSWVPVRSAGGATVSGGSPRGLLPWSLGALVLAAAGALGALALRRREARPPLQTG